MKKKNSFHFYVLIYICRKGINMKWSYWAFYCARKEKCNDVTCVKFEVKCFCTELFFSQQHFFSRYWKKLNFWSIFSPSWATRHSYLWWFPVCCSCSHCRDINKKKLLLRIFSTKILTSLSIIPNGEKFTMNNISNNSHIKVIRINDEKVFSTEVSTNSPRTSITLRRQGKKSSNVSHSRFLRKQARKSSVPRRRY